MNLNEIGGPIKEQFELTDIREHGCNVCGSTDIPHIGFPAVDIRTPSKLVVMVPFCSDDCKETFVEQYESQIRDNDP